MNSLKKASRYLLAALALAVCAHGPALAGVLKARLDNGLTVVVEEVKTSPVVSIQMWVRVGSADEPDRLAGISHVFEHMLFKGTQRRKVGEIASAIESIGGDINAYTSFDNTVYHLTVPSRHFQTGLDIIADAIQHSSFDRGELAKELEVILEEIRMNEDNPERALYKSLLSLSYGAHPYGRPVIGSPETVKSIERHEILTHFKKWYVPGNMTLVIAGDITAGDALDAARREFKGFKKAALPGTTRPGYDAATLVRTRVETQPIKETHVGVAFRIPGEKDEDTYAIDVAAGVLGGGETSRLYKRLKLDDDLVHSITAYPMSLKDSGLFFITGALDAKDTLPALSVIMAEVLRLGEAGPSPEEMEKVKLSIESSFVYSRETVEGIAGKLGYYETHLGDFNYEKKYLEGIRAVSPDDVRRVVMRYLSPASMRVAAIYPEGAADASATDEMDSAIRHAEEAFARPAAPVEEARKEKTVMTRLDNGMTLIVREARANPTVAFYAAFPGGLRFESTADNGIGNFMAEMLTRGTEKRDREALAGEVEGMAGSLGAFSGWNSTGVSAKFLSRFFDRGLRLFAEVISRPGFPEDEIGSLRKDVIAAIARQEDYLPGYTFKLLYRSLYATHPYGMPVFGSIETVSSFTREDLARRYRELIVPERMVLAVVGDVNAEYVAGKVAEAFKDFKAGGAPLWRPPVEERQTSIRSTGKELAKAQTHVGAAFLATPVGHPDGYALKVLAETLSGQGGRLYLKLRDEKSLAYSVSAFLKEGADPGIFGVYIATAPEKRDEALEGILGEIDALRKAEVPDAELRRAKNSLIGGYEIGLQDTSDQAANLATNELMGLGYGFHKVYPDKIEAVTAADVLMVAREYLTLDAYTVSIVGPKAEAPGGDAAGRGPAR
jgi:zinc protease